MKLIHGRTKQKNPEYKTAIELAAYIRTLPQKKLCKPYGCENFHLIPLVPSILIQKKN